MVLNIDREKVKIALGMKQLLPNPWDNVEEKYPIGTVHHWRSRQRDELRCIRQTGTRH